MKYVCYSLFSILFLSPLLYQTSSFDSDFDFTISVSPFSLGFFVLFVLLRSFSFHHDLLKFDINPSHLKFIKEGDLYFKQNNYFN